MFDSLAFEKPDEAWNRVFSRFVKAHGIQRKYRAKPGLIGYNRRRDFHIRPPKKLSQQAKTTPVKRRYKH
jgi:hypothetical protein